MHELETLAGRATSSTTRRTGAPRGAGALADELAGIDAAEPASPRGRGGAGAALAAAEGAIDAELATLSAARDRRRRASTPACSTVRAPAPRRRRRRRQARRQPVQRLPPRPVDQRARARSGDAAGESPTARSAVACSCPDGAAMFFWFIGTSIAAVWFVFRDPRFDYRLLVVGAVLPLVDGLFGGARVMHTLVFSLALLAIVMLATIGRRPASARCCSACRSARCCTSCSTAPGPTPTCSGGRSAAGASPACELPGVGRLVERPLELSAWPSWSGSGAAPGCPARRRRRIVWRPAARRSAARLWDTPPTC